MSNEELVKAVADKLQANDKPPKKYIEFSKIIFVVVASLTIIITFFTIFIIADTKDTTPLAYLIPSIFGEFGVATGFYYTKSKAENVIKISKDIEKAKLKPNSVKLANSIVNNTSDSTICIEDETERMI